MDRRAWQAIELQRVGHGWSTWACAHMFSVLSFSVLAYHRTVDVVPSAAQWDLVVYPSCIHWFLSADLRLPVLPFATLSSLATTSLFFLSVINAHFYNRALITAIWQMRKLRLREVKSFAQSHPAVRCRSQIQRQAYWVLEPHPSYYTRPICCWNS